MLADIQTIDKHIPKLSKEAKSDPTKRTEFEELEKLRHELNSGYFPKSKIQNPKSTLQLLAFKPTIYAFNVDETGLTDSKLQSQLKSLVSPSDCVFVCAKLEEELRGLDEADAAELLASYGVHESGLAQLARAAYHTLGLQSYLTAGPKEVRAWTIRTGATAPEAAGVIHTDFEKGFIAAQIIDYRELVACGSEAAARAAGKVRTVGRDYHMQPGDVVEFRFNKTK